VYFRRQQTFENEDESRKRSRTSWPPVHAAQYSQAGQHTPNTSLRATPVSNNLQTPIVPTLQRLVRPAPPADNEWGKVENN